MAKGSRDDTTQLATATHGPVNAKRIQKDPKEGLFFLKNTSLALALCSILHLSSESFLLQSLESIIASDRDVKASFQACLLIQDMDLCFNATETWVGLGMFSGTKKYRQMIAANCHTESIPFFSIACLLFCARL